MDIDADRAKLLLDDLTLDRIITAVGETLTKPNRDVLRRDLLLCIGQHSIASGPGRSGFVSRQISRLNSIQKHAKKTRRFTEGRRCRCRNNSWGVVNQP
jgi:hypothetical protein